MRRAFALLGLLLGLVRAETPSTTMALVPNLHGLPLVQVQLFRDDGTSKDVLMLLDTGSEMTILDRDLDAAFWTPNKDLANVTVDAVAASGANVPAQPILLRQIRCGPWSRLGPMAIRLDLTAINQTMDAPIGGVIGMNLLRGQCFRLDFRNQVLRWGGQVEGEYLRDLSFKKRDGIPLIKVDVDHRRLEVICDTGAEAFMSVSEQDAKAFKKERDPRSMGVNADLAGIGPQKGIQTLSGSVAVGSKVWCAPEVEVDESSLMGTAAMWPSVWFDFKKNQVGFAVGPSGCLESKPPVKQALHAFWDRSSVPARLMVVGVKPGSRYESAGIRAGDVLQAFGDLRGDQLNLASLRQAVLAQKTRWVTVERKGLAMKIELPEEKGLLEGPTDTK